MIRPRRWMLLAPLAAIVAVNLVQFHAIDTALQFGRYAAISPSSTSDILVLGQESEQIAQTYSLYLGLSQTSPDAHLQVSSSSSFRVEEIREYGLSFGQAASVDLVAFDEDAGESPLAQLIDAGGQVAAEGVVSIATRKDVPWRIVTASCGVKDGPTPGRDLVLVTWAEASGESLGLVEECLLPAGFIGGGS